MKSRRAEVVKGSHAKDRAKERDGFMCQVCGFNLFVHAHHITPVRSGGSDALSNLITLCPNHHLMAHAGLITKQQLRAILKGVRPLFVGMATEPKHRIPMRGDLP